MKSKKISFTGSTHTGKPIMESAAMSNMVVMICLLGLGSNLAGELRTPKQV